MYWWPAWGAFMLLLSAFSGEGESLTDKQFAELLVALILGVIATYLYVKENQPRG